VVDTEKMTPSHVALFVILAASVQFTSARFVYIYFTFTRVLFPRKA